MGLMLVNTLPIILKPKLLSLRTVPTLKNIFQLRKKSKESNIMFYIRTMSLRIWIQTLLAEYLPGNNS